MNKKTKIALFILSILFGVFIIVFGGYDDSPGAQVIGFVVVVIGIVSMIKSWKRNMVK